MLLHRLQQRRLHLGRGAVDLVGQNEVGEYGALAHRKILVLLRIDQRTQQVGRQQVGSELDAGEIGVDGLRQRRYGQCLGQSGHAFKQDVSVRQQSYKQRVDQMTLTDDDAFNLRTQRVDKYALALDMFVKLLDVNHFHSEIYFVYHSSTTT